MEIKEMDIMRKYNSYKIIIAYTNGDKEEVKLNGINNNSYKETLTLYKQVKEEYLNSSNIETISFIGQTIDGELGVLFTKELNKKDELTIEEFVNNNLNKSVNETCKEIYYSLELIKAQQEKLSSIVGMYDKKRDIILHMILNSDNNRFSTKEELDEFKINIYDKLKRNEICRREAKDNLAKINGLNSKLKQSNVKLEEIEDIFRIYLKQKEFNLTSEEYKEKVEKTVKYRTEKERIVLMKKYQYRYKKVVNDPTKKELYFYNKVGEGKRKAI